MPVCSCNDPDVSNVTDCTGDWVVDPSLNVTAPRVWANSYPNFDNVGNSLIVCFITATLNGYTSIMVQVRCMCVCIAYDTTRTCSRVSHCL